MNYFDFYQIPISFKPNLKVVKKQFYQNSRQYHPDFYAQATAVEQEKALQQSTLNNKAYHTLRNADAVLKYVLELKGLLKEGERQTLPQSFLLEMMDINEALMELEFDSNPEQLHQIGQEVGTYEQNLEEKVTPILVNWKDGVSDSADLEKVKEFYHKKRYLLRIKESLRKFAIS